MKVTHIFRYPARVSFLLFASTLMPLLLSAQSTTNNKKTSSPPPSKKSDPPTAPKPVQPPPKTPAPTAAKPASTAPQAPSNKTTPSPSPNKSAPPPPNFATPKLPTAASPAVPGTAAPKPIPIRVPGTVLHAGGAVTVTTQVGHTLEYDKSGHLEKVITRNGAEALYAPGGKVSTITTATGTTITHGPGGQRQVVTERRDANNHLQTRIVNLGPSRGYVERTFQRGGKDYVRRTYVSGARTYVNVYRCHHFHGVVYYHYVPAFYYQPMFYGWANAPWAAPAYYTWGWYAAPWYAPYGYYFTPYPVYPSAAFWLTDFLVSENLRAAYEAQAEANASAVRSQEGYTPVEQAPNTAAVLSPEVKQMIADQVKAQLAAQQDAARERGSSPPAPSDPTPSFVQPSAPAEEVPAALDPKFRVFIVTTSLDVTTNGQPCSLRPGDVLMRSENTSDKDNTVAVNVLSSQKSDCGSGSSPRIQVADLQEMHNRFREQVDTGLNTLAENQGKNGIPSAPAVEPGENPDGMSAADLEAAAELLQQLKEADQAEKDVQQASSSATTAGRSTS